MLGLGQVSSRIGRMWGKTSAFCLLGGRVFKVMDEVIALHFCLSIFFCEVEELEQEVESEER